MDQQVTVSNLLESLANKWPSTIVCRTEIKKFSGGLMSEKYLANLDSQGKGPKGRFRSGRKICYPVNDVLTWLETRSKIVTEKQLKKGGAQ